MSYASDIVPQFVSAARDYCQLIDDASAHSPRRILETMQIVLARLYSLALELPLADPTSDDEPPDSMSHDDWRRVYDRLGAFLGDSDAYWLVFGPIDPDDHESIPHTLADDLSDIYRDLQSASLESGRDPSPDELWSLRFSFETHWGHHAVDALTAIHSMLYGPHAPEN